MRVVRPGALEASEYTSTHTLVPETSDIVLANTFPTTEKKLKLDAVAVETDLDDVDYEVYIKQDGIDSTDNDPSQGAKLVARGHSKLAGIHKKSIPLTVIKKETSYTIIVVQHPKDKNPQNYSAGIIVAPAFRNSKLSNPGVSWLGYIGKNGKITNWVDMKFIDEDSRNGHGSLQGVAPYVFGYSVN
ncbi:MAG: lectin like domain-containing protein [Lactobacillales bacterium]|nr:lectin like domain-containing protein [Lactobacillales bacterium]